MTLSIKHWLLIFTHFLYAALHANADPFTKKQVRIPIYQSGYSVDYNWKDSTLESYQYNIHSGNEQRPVAITTLQYNDEGALSTKSATTTKGTFISLRKFKYNENGHKISESVFTNDSEVVYTDSLRYIQGALSFIDRYQNGTRISYRQIERQGNKYKIETLYKKIGEEHQPILAWKWYYHDNGNIRSLEFLRYSVNKPLRAQRVWIQEYTYREGRIKSMAKWFGKGEYKQMADSTAYSFKDDRTVVERLYDSDNSLLQETEVTLTKSGIAISEKLQPKVLFHQGLLSIVLPEKGEAAVSIFRINGVKVHTLVLKGRASYSLDLTQYLAHGFYIGVVRAGNRQFQLKLPLFRRSL